MRQFETILSESIPSNAFIMIVLKSFSDREKYLNYKRAALGMLFVCFIWSFLVYFSLNKKIEDFFYIAPFLILAIILLALISEEKEIEINSLNFNSGDKIIIRDAGLNVHRKRYYLILLNYSSSMTGDATFYNEEFLYQEELLSSNGFYLLNFPEFKISEMGCSHSNSKDLTWVISMDDGRSFHYFKINASTC